MAVNRIPLYKNNYTTLKQVFASQITEYDANGTPFFKNTYESKTDLYINKNTRGLKYFPKKKNNTIEHFSNCSDKKQTIGIIHIHNILENTTN